MGGRTKRRPPGDLEGSEAPMTAEPKAPIGQRFVTIRGRLAPQSVDAGEAARTVAEDASALVRAEIALAKAELAAAAGAKATGAGLLTGAGIMGWLALQGLLVTVGLALALIVPGWAAALIVSVVLLAVGGILGLVGKRKMATPVSLDTTKRNVQEDLEWAKSHLTKQ